MANLKLKNPSGGSLALVSADGASDLTVTFPAVTGTAMVSGNMPAFSAYLSSNQSITDSTATKIAFDTETFDTNSRYNNTGSTVNGIPAYSFLPNVAGYYLINAGGYAKNNLNTQAYSQITMLKNGSDYRAGSFVWIGGGGAINWSVSVISDIVYCNGTTDYINIYAVISGTSPLYQGGTSVYTNFSGVLIKAA